jgi:hypothetical protein
MLKRLWLWRIEDGRLRMSLEGIFVAAIGIDAVLGGIIWWLESL